MGVPYSGPRLIVGTLLAAAALVSAERSARAAVCAAGNSICTIGAAFEIRAGCVNDFATRPVTLTGTLASEVPGQGFTIRAPFLTLDGGDLLATGASGSKGGAIALEATGPLILRTHDRRGRRFQRRVPRPARPFEQPSLNGLLRGPRRASIAGTGVPAGCIAGTGVPAGCTHLLMWGQRVGRLPHFGRSYQSGTTEGQANGE
jgi:hypothetical protein